MLKASARYAFGLRYTRMMALNDDLTYPTPTNLIGGAGPFDFSGETIGAVPVTIKLDGTAYTLSVALTAAVDDAAVTVEEVVAALIIAFAANTPAIVVTPSKVAGTGRIKLVTGGTEKFIQFYGTLAEICMFGQGHGVKMLTSDTIRSFARTQVRKDAERFTTTDAWGDDTEIVTDGYLKGETCAIVDTAEDWDMYALCEGVTIADDESLEAPNSTTVKPFIGVEIFYGKYREGENREEECVGYRQVVFAKCKGRGGDKTHERGFANSNYTVEAMAYRDLLDAMHGPWKKYELTVPEFTALGVETL